jgi:hypothetical protein
MRRASVPLEDRRIEVRVPKIDYCLCNVCGATAQYEISLGTKYGGLAFRLCSGCIKKLGIAIVKKLGIERRPVSA